MSPSVVGFHVVDAFFVAFFCLVFKIKLDVVDHVLLEEPVPEVARVEEARWRVAVAFAEAS